MANADTDIRKKLRDTADALFKSKQYAQAIKYWDTLIALSPDTGEFFYRRGRSHEEIYRLPDFEAISDYLASAKRGYRNENCFFNIGLNYYGYNDSLALIYFRKALEINPNDQDAVFWVKECQERISEPVHPMVMPSRHH